MGAKYCRCATVTAELGCVEARTYMGTSAYTRIVLRDTRMEMVRNYNDNDVGFNDKLSVTIGP